MVKSSCPGKLGRRVRAMVKLLPGRMDRKVRVMVKFLSSQPRPADRVNQEGRGQFNFTIKRPQNFQKIRILRILTGETTQITSQLPFSRLI